MSSPACKWPGASAELSAPEDLTDCLINGCSSLSLELPLPHELHRSCHLPLCLLLPQPKTTLVGGLSPSQVRGREGQQGVRQLSMAWQPLQELETNLQPEPHLWTLYWLLQPGSAQHLWPLVCPQPPASHPGRMGDRGTCCWQEVHSTCKKGQSAPNLPSTGTVQQPQAWQSQHKVGLGSLWCFPA